MSHLPVLLLLLQLCQLLQSGCKAKELFYKKSIWIQEWPDKSLQQQLGQVTGLDVCDSGFPFIFHRADRDWQNGDFDEHNEFTRIAAGPIQSNTIVKASNQLSNGEAVDKFGDNQFFMPHGLTAMKDYLWLTDVARHQIIKMNMTKPNKVLLEIGVKFVPGSDKEHFCKPTHVVESRNGIIFVADGYCNSRIIKMSSKGEFISSWGEADDGDDIYEDNELSLPHHLALIEEKDMLCVADREHFRVVCYSAGLNDQKSTGKHLLTIENREFGPIYAISYNKKYDILFILNGINVNHPRSNVIVYHLGSQLIIDTIEYPGKNGFGMAHVMAGCSNDDCLIIGGLSKECSSDPVICLIQSHYRSSTLRNLWLYQIESQHQ